MSSTAKQTKDNRHFVGDFDFQNKFIFHLIRSIERDLAPLYEKNLSRENPLKRNMKFRNSRINYLAILKRLRYYTNFLDKLRPKFNNKIQVKCSHAGFEKYFPNITSLFIERHFLLKNIQHHEEDNLQNCKTISAADYCLYSIAKKLSDFGLKYFDYSYKYDYWLHFDFDYYWDSEDEDFE